MKWKTFLAGLGVFALITGTNCDIETGRRLNRELPLSEEPPIVTKVDFDEIENHKISFDLKQPKYDINNVHLYLYDKKTKDTFSKVDFGYVDYEFCLGREGKEFHFETPTLDYIPEDFGIKISFDTTSQKIKDLKKTPVEHIILDTFGTKKGNFNLVLVERDVRPQTAYVFEGDSLNPFSRILFSFPVSTGTWKPGEGPPRGATALGTFSVKGKNPRKIREFETEEIWDMKWAIWYDCGTGLNGIHQGFHGTPYGRPVSHGCIRVPYEFSRRLFDIMDKNELIIIIGNKKMSPLDSYCFDFSSYETYKEIIARAQLRQEMTDSLDYEHLFFPFQNQESIDSLIFYNRAFLNSGESPFNKFEFSDLHKKMYELLLKTDSLALRNSQLKENPGKQSYHFLWKKIERGDWHRKTPGSIVERL